MATAAPASSGSKLPWVLAGVALLVIAGLVGFIVLRGMNSSAQDEAPMPRNRNATTATSSQAAPPVASSPSSTASAPGPTAAAASPSPSQPAATPAPAAQKVAKKVDCDKKCYQVYDNCMAEYRQNPDPESICRARQQSCLIKCQ